MVEAVGEDGSEDVVVVLDEDEDENYEVLVMEVVMMSILSGSRISMLQNSFRHYPLQKLQVQREEEN